MDSCGGDALFDAADILFDAERPAIQLGFSSPQGESFSLLLGWGAVRGGGGWW